MGPLTVAEEKADGKWTVPRGDCGTDVPAEEGVIGPEGLPDIFGVEKVGVGGN